MRTQGHSEFMNRTLNAAQSRGTGGLRRFCWPLIITNPNLTLIIATCSPQRLSAMTDKFSATQKVAHSFRSKWNSLFQVHSWTCVDLRSIDSVKLYLSMTPPPPPLLTSNTSVPCRCVHKDCTKGLWPGSVQRPTFLSPRLKHCPLPLLHGIFC